MAKPTVLKVSARCRGGLFAASLLCLFTAARVHSAVQMTYYVAPQGSDSNSGTEAAPFATLAKARSAVRSFVASQSLTGDVVVYMRGGIYNMSAPIALDAADSGENGYYVIYASYPGEHAQLSAGTRIPIGSWTLDSGSVYRTSVPAGTDFRQLYVDERRAIRARSPNTGSYLSFPTEKQADGFDVALGSLNGIANLANKVEFAIPIEWMHKRLRISGFYTSGAYTRAVINSTEWDDVLNQPQGNRNYSGRQYWLENAREFLDSPGEFYLNTATNTLYYWPLPGQNMATAEVIRPVHTTIFQLNGTFAAPVHHIKFENLVFTHTNWTRPNSYGFVDVQANSLIPAPPNDNTDSQYRHNQRKDRIPGAIHANTADNIVIRGNRFARLGGTAILFTLGGNDNLVAGNSIVDVAGGGIEFGNDAYQPTNTRMFPRRNTVQDNLVARVGLDYFGSVGVLGYYTDSQTIRNNELTCLPYSGISQGWGWSSPDPADSRQNAITNNLVRTYSGRLRDGGAIYTVGAQPSSSMSGNYLAEQNVATVGSIGGALYPDEGTEWYTISNSVIEGASRWLYIWTTSIRNNTIQTTYSDTGAIRNNGQNNTVQQPILVTNGNWPAAAQSIIASAGIQPSNLAAKRPAIPADTVVDDADMCFAPTTGSWYWSGGLPGKYAGGYWYAPTTTGPATARVRWRPVLPQDGNYRVLVWYASNPDRATAAPYQVSYNGGSASIPVNQTTAGGQWVALGTWPFKAGATSYVELANNSPGTYVQADAVRFVGDTIVDNGSYRSAARTGTWYSATSLTDKYGANYRYAVSSSTETATFRWTPNLPVGGSYNVYVWYSANANRASNARYTVRGAGGTATVVQVDQTANGGQWVSIGTHSFDAGVSGHVELSNQANGTYVGADAVRFEPR
jgi:hypothetical protein